MKTAVILTTYNRPECLEKVLWGYRFQTTADFTIYIADDGSTDETREVIERESRDHFGDRLIHVWQHDHGFRKCEILNRAIVAATDSDYLIFTDGDCIPRRDFVEVHIQLARPGCFLSGGVVWLPRSVNDAITLDDVRTGRMARGTWLTQHGWRAGRRRLRVLHSRPAAAALDLLTPTRATFNGHNSSVWRKAIVAANGFDAEMGYGGLDRALGERLANLEVRGRQVRHRAVCFHLDHDRPYRLAHIIAQNRDIRQRIRTSGETRARTGIAELT